MSSSSERVSSSSEGDLVILRGDAKKGGSDPRNVGEDHKKPCEDLRLVTSFSTSSAAFRRTCAPEAETVLPQATRLAELRPYGWSREALAFLYVSASHEHTKAVAAATALQKKSARFGWC
jgi:hypothetical protein